MNEQQRKAMELALEELKHIKTWCLRSIGIGLVNENVLAKIEEALMSLQDGAQPDNQGKIQTVDSSTERKAD